MRRALAVGLVFSGCCSNVVFLELLAREFPGCGNIVTFAQFLFIAVEGFIFEANFGRKRPAIPIRYYLIMVAMFFTVSVVNNYALNLNIAMPLHMIFRSGSLIASMVLGIIILKKRYSASKYTSIALVSMGIFICTLMSAKQVASKSSLSEADGLHVFMWWLLGLNRGTDLRPPDVSQNGDLSRDHLQTVWKAFQGGTVLQPCPAPPWLPPPRSGHLRPCCSLQPVCISTAETGAAMRNIAMSHKQPRCKPESKTMISCRWQSHIS
ncbi:UDP-xylose and UDP-N-acetylglucosamine transporter isoform X4 [Chelonia mydas]|uniref:UDP-xylose and UDP-N-acetylglucosamine transporter isoform X4 n=1 Tax=Chelonia mydas TaxID=8469 RepID=UPI001CA82B51|nr:UDP-xylose and UDP-N-acetylglucosamine transporter isoform X4 [Chelonia mydas]